MLAWCMRNAGLILLVGMMSCRPSFEPGAAPPDRTCPAGYARDEAREGRLVARLEANGFAKDRSRRASPVCFGPARSLGVLAGPRVVLRADLQDEELAARLAHLVVHLEDDVGDGCRHGLAAAVASEERARAAEDLLRSRWALGASPEDASEAIRDYKRRCTKP
jgi:hypothetical protein